MPSEESRRHAGIPREELTYGLLGRTLGHSWSPQLHTMLGSTPYDLVELEPEDVGRFMAERRFRGLNVTIPYKRTVVPLVDELSPAAARLGAVNTVVRREDGSLLGDNTDVWGFSWLLDRFARERCDAASAGELLSGRKALILGSGGASRAVLAALEEAGAETCVISREGPNTYDRIVRDHGAACLIVNATPVGMFPNCPASPLESCVLEALPNLMGVIDVVYNPWRTGICLAAERAGIPCESGLGMLVGQAKRSSELFRGVTIADDEIDRIQRAISTETRNVVLIGMPGSGKTGAGRRLAHLTGRPFVDADDAIELSSGRAPSKIIADDGEDAFRSIETQIMATYGKESGLVIACGGGVVTRAENYPLLHQNGAIVMLDRRIEELSSAGRPLSKAKGVEQLARERMHLYREWADLVLPCTGSAAGDAEAIVLLLELERRES